MISDLKSDFADPDSDVVGAEFVGTSISSGGDQDQAAFHKEWDARMPDNPHWKFIDAHRGYHLFDIRRDGIDAQVRVAETVLKPDAASSTLARLRVDAGSRACGSCDAGMPWDSPESQGILRLRSASVLTVLPPWRPTVRHLTRQLP